MSLVGIDVGSTHVKAGLFSEDGVTVRVASRATPVSRSGDGRAEIDPDALWRATVEALGEVTTGAAIGAIGVTGMAETGLLIDAAQGNTRSRLLPWFDASSEPQARRIAARSDASTRFRSSGLAVTFKASLAKILWLRDLDPTLIKDARWLGAPEFVAWKLCGAMATDASLAGRTCAFDIAGRRWDAEWLAEWDVPPGLFAEILPAGAPAGCTNHAGWTDVPVAVAGHDHVCAAYGVGAALTAEVFDSMGTAETLLGSLPARALSGADEAIGLMYGCHVVPDRLYWMGGLSAAGGSVEWLRGLLGDAPASYAALRTLLLEAGREPTGLLFFPYLLGATAPHRDSDVRGAIVGLASRHGRAALARAVIEGLAFELEVIRRAGERATGRPIREVVAAGGGTRLPEWLQVKADVSNVTIAPVVEAEAALLGAALLAGVGAGLYRDHAEAQAVARGCTRTASSLITPDALRHARYNDLFEHGYLPLQAPLREFGRWSTNDRATSSH